jgi:uncharacterized SAM-binding protein YcdF (DUF218 family)
MKATPSPKFYRVLLRRRCFLVPTWRGWLAACILFSALGSASLRLVYPFLAIKDPAPAKVLVVEGWNPDSAFEKAMAEFRNGGYQKLYVTGGPLEKGAPLSQYKTHAELGAATLIGLGMRPAEVEAVPAPTVRRDRTYTSAVALAKRFQIESVPPKEINLVSVGPHCRRSRMLFAKALGDGIQVGILPVAPDDYDPAHWWRSSQGFRMVSGEVIAYVYARLFFNPAEEL